MVGDEAGARTETNGLPAGGPEWGYVTSGMRGVEEGAPLCGEGGLLGFGRYVDVVASTEVPDEEDGDGEDDEDDGHADARRDGTVGSHLMVPPPHRTTLAWCYYVKGITHGSERNLE